MEPAIQRALHRAVRNPSRKCETNIVKREEAPARGPKQQIGLTFDAVKVREKTGNQTGKVDKAAIVKEFNARQPGMS